jgi:hypothetical protein
MIERSPISAHACKNILVTCAALYLLWWGYQDMYFRIRLAQGGKKVTAEVIEFEPGKPFDAIKVRYSVEKNTRSAWLKVAPSHNMKQGTSLEVWVLASQPERPVLDFDKARLDRDVYYFLIAASIFGVYMITRITLMSTVPAG